VQERSHPLTPVKLAEGKTKIIWGTEDPQVVRIENKDDITAGDGLRRDSMKGKAVLGIETTVNVFQLLQGNGITTHFVSRDSDTSFIAQKAKMIPLECVARRIAAGSFLKRNPEFQEGQRLGTLPVEFYFKDDSRHDPIMEHDPENNKALLYDAKQTTDARQPIGEVNVTDVGSRGIIGHTAENKASF